MDWIAHSTHLALQTVTAILPQVPSSGDDEPIPARSVELLVPPDALLDRSVAAQIVAPTRRALSSRTVVPLVVVTRPAKATFEVSTGSPGTLSVDHIQLG